MLLTRAPLYRGLLPFSCDLHVLGAPLTFVLSQDQTLQLDPTLQTLSVWFGTFFRTNLLLSRGRDSKVALFTSFDSVFRDRGACAHHRQLTLVNYSCFPSRPF